MNKFLKKYFICILFFITIFNISSVNFDLSKSLNMDNLKKIKDDLLKKQKEFKEKKGKEQQSQKNENKLKIAFLPFDVLFENTLNNNLEKYLSQITLNELAIKMIITDTFEPFSIKEWTNSIYGDKKADSVSAIISKAKEVNIPVDFICHGVIFKIGYNYAIKIALYPIDSSKYQTSYYYRSFNNINSFDAIADEIISEFSKRANSKQKPLFNNKSIFIDNFNYSFVEKFTDKTGQIKEQKPDYIDFDNVIYKKGNDFLNDLFLYKFHLSQLFNVQNNDLKIYVKSGITEKSDYTLSGNLDIVKEGRIYNYKLTINLLSNDQKKGKELFNKTFYYKRFNLNKIEEDMNIFIKNISLVLLDYEEQKQVCQMNIDSFYGNSPMYYNSFYLGKRNNHNLLLPNSDTNIKTVFYKNWMKNDSISTYPFVKNSNKNSFFKYSIGIMLTSRLMMHPFYNDKTKISFGNENTEYELKDFYNDTLSNPFLSSQTGVGIDFTMEHKYFAISSVTSVIIGECFRNAKISSDETYNINGRTIKNFDSDYTIGKLSIITDLSILPYAMFLRNDSPVRLYLGLGFFNSLWVNYTLYEQVSGNAKIDGSEYKYKTEYENKYSMNLDLGIFPEFGVIYKFLKFNFKTGIAYNFNLYKYNLFSGNKKGSIDTFNTSNLAIKLSCGYYIN